jgi:beta-mannosidase
VPKAAYGALRDACRPVIVVADRLPATVAPGDALALDVHVVSDLRTPIGSATVRAVLAWTGGSHAWTWAGDIGADECRRVGTLQVVVPDSPGPLDLTLTLEAGDHSTGNHYEAEIVI